MLPTPRAPRRRFQPALNSACLSHPASCGARARRVDLALWVNGKGVLGVGRVQHIGRADNVSVVREGGQTHRVRARQAAATPPSPICRFGRLIYLHALSNLRRLSGAPALFALPLCTLPVA